MHTEQCPLSNTIGPDATKPCHGCGGRGWVQIADANDKAPEYDYGPWTEDIAGKKYPGHTR